ncbi:hypothetical protein ARMGADRAFT_1031998 [Armillaria gallica]|uniref:Uncharacterized protein n=1 Tax=Armillaria gallica TaxID=47427 RepID=A0A2H3D6M7_ARMGA|nr:hypothetical protein ARMGADRAFT_1031998 [Armillaria gallica]
MAPLYFVLYDLVIDHLADGTPAPTACSLVSRMLLPLCQHHLFRHITFYPGDGQCARLSADKASLVRELTIFERREPGDKGVCTDAWTEALPRVLPLLVLLRRVKSSGKMYLDHCIEVLAQLTSLTLDGVFFSSLTEVATFFGCVPLLAINVVTVGRGDDDDNSHEGGLCSGLETLKVGIGLLRVRWIRFLFGTDSVISLENLKELVFLVTSEGAKFGDGDVAGPHQSLDHITPVPDISRLCSFTVFVPIAYRDRYEVRRALGPIKSTKVNTVDTAICALDWTRRMLDIGTRLEEVVLIVNASSVVNGEGEGGVGASAQAERHGARGGRVSGDDSGVAWECLGKASRRETMMMLYEHFLHCYKAPDHRRRRTSTDEAELVDTPRYDWYRDDAGFQAHVRLVTTIHITLTCSGEQGVFKEETKEPPNQWDINGRQTECSNMVFQKLALVVLISPPSSISLGSRFLTPPPSNGL